MKGWAVRAGQEEEEGDEPVACSSGKKEWLGFQKVTGQWRVVVSRTLSSRTCSWWLWLC